MSANSSTTRVSTHDHITRQVRRTQPEGQSPYMYDALCHHPDCKITRKPWHTIADHESSCRPTLKDITKTPQMAHTRPLFEHDLSYPPMPPSAANNQEFKGYDGPKPGKKVQFRDRATRAAETRKKNEQELGIKDKRDAKRARREKSEMLKKERRNRERLSKAQAAVQEDKKSLAAKAAARK